VEHREAELREVAPCDAQADNPARFLRELRQLRDGAGLGQTELAVRAHYPRDAIKAAEAGPALPELPVLSAYVRGCGGAVTEWEERWRALTSSPALPLLPTRTAGCSDAATAGARIGSVSLAADAHDPSLVMAALSRVAHGIAVNPQPAPLSVSVPAASPVPLPSTAREAAAAAPAAAAPDAGWGQATDADRSAAAPQATERPGLAPVSTFSRPAGTRRTRPSKPVIVTVVILLCLAAVLLAIFA
jgi:DNA-binding XRE family transcriptional regulator